MSFPPSSRMARFACIAFAALALASCGGGGGGAAPAPAPGGDAPTPGANSILATAAPAGALRVTLGSTQAVAVTFASSDAQAATNLRVTTDLAALPAGWSSPSGTFACARVARDAACRLELSYAPTAAVPPRTLELAYAYTDSAGKSRSDTLAIAYEAVAARTAYIANVDDHNVRQCLVGPDGRLADCTTAGEALLFRPSGVVFQGSTAYVLNTGNNNIIQCEVGASGAFANCQDSGAWGLDMPYAMAIHGSRLYVANAGNDTLAWCVIGADGGLGSDCRGQSDPTFRQPMNVGIHEGRVYLVNTASSTVSVCDLEPELGFENCRNAGATLLNRPQGLAIAGSVAFITNYGDRTVTACAIGGDGRLSICDTLLTTPWSAGGIAVNGPNVYITQGSDHSVLHCPVGPDGSLAACGDSGATGLNEPMGITLR